MKITKKGTTQRTTGTNVLRVDNFVDMIESMTPLLALFKFLNGDAVKITRVAVREQFTNYAYLWDGDRNDRVVWTNGPFLTLWPSPPVSLQGVESYNFIRRVPSSTYVSIGAELLTYMDLIRGKVNPSIDITENTGGYFIGSDIAMLDKPTNTYDPAFRTADGLVRVNYHENLGWRDPYLVRSYEARGLSLYYREVEILLEFCMPGSGDTEILYPLTFIVRRSELPDTFSQWKSSWATKPLTAEDVLQFLQTLIATCNDSNANLSKYIPVIHVPGLFKWSTDRNIFITKAFAQDTISTAYEGVELPPLGEIYVYEHRIDDTQSGFAVQMPVDPPDWLDTAITLALDVAPEDYFSEMDEADVTVDESSTSVSYSRSRAPAQRICIVNLDRSNATGVTGYFCATPETVTNLSYVLDPGTMSRLTNMMEST